MAVLKDDILLELANGVLEMDEERTVTAAHASIDAQIDAYDAIDKGLSAGMDRAGQLFEEEEYFIPELLLCSDAMYAGLEVLRPHLKAKEQQAKEKVVLGVIQGDTHDIGKNLVKIMLETAGFEVIDLGRDVPPRDFVETAKNTNAKIIGISTLMTTTMDGMEEVVRLLQQQDVKSRFKVMVGGGPISPGFAKKIGADGYAVNAAEAAKLARELVKEE